VANRFVVSQGEPPLDVERADLVAEGTRSAAGGAGLLVAEGSGLLFEEDFQGALAEPVGGGLSDLFQGVEVEVEGVVVGAGAAGNDFAPLGGEVSAQGPLSGPPGSTADGHRLR
jgi:hypothetical protein